MTETEFDAAMAAARLELQRAKSHVSTELSPTGGKRVTEKMRVRVVNAQAAVDLLFANEIHQSRIAARKAAYKEREKQRKRRRNREHEAIYREKNKEELRRKARDRMSAFRQTDDYKVWLEKSRQQRKSYKEKRRREAGAVPRAELTARAAQRAKSADDRRLAKAAFLANFVGPPTPGKGMTDAEYYRWRMTNDPDFYAKELDRAQRYKVRTRPGYQPSVVEWSAMPQAIKEVKHITYRIAREINRREANEDHQRTA